MFAIIDIFSFKNIKGYISLWLKYKKSYQEKRLFEKTMELNNNTVFNSDFPC